MMALDELWGTVWHQGIVYECTSVVVPFLVRLAIDPSGDDASRSQVAFLLASIAGANSFVFPRALARCCDRGGCETPVRQRPLVI